MARKQRRKSMREAFEEAVLADPDDLGHHAAYADWLMEQDDASDRARGEFITTQLALEDPSLPTERRQQLRERETELLQAHQRDWLGELAPFLLDGHPLQSWAALELPAGTPQATFRCRRGWLDQLHINSLTLAFARAIKRAPAMRLVRELVMEYIQDDGDGEEETIPEDNIPAGERWAGLHPLRGATNLSNIRLFRLGPDQGDDYSRFRCYVASRVTTEIVGLLPRLEELYLWCNEFNLNDLLALPTLSNLRVLLLYHGEQVHRIHQLDSPTFRNLTHLLIHPHHLAWSAWDDDDVQAGYSIQEEGYLPLSVVQPFLHSRHLTRLTHLRLRCSSMGDAGCQEIVRSGALKRLKQLDLRHGAITDRGAALLADCPDVKHLEWLDLDRNGLSAMGVARLRALGIPLRIDNQQSDQELNPTEDYRSPQYLYEGEFE